MKKENYKQMMKDVIESFDSASHAAICAHMTPSLLAYWRENGLPLREIFMPNHIKMLVEEAQKRGCNVQLNDVIEASKIMRFGGKKDV
jgi:hypothetical protein